LGYVRRIEEVVDYNRWAVDYKRLQIAFRPSRLSKTIFDFNYSVENKFEVSLKCSKTIFEFDSDAKIVVDCRRPQLTPVTSTPTDGRSSRAHDF
jgi:hypothetical protein